MAGAAKFDNIDAPEVDQFEPVIAEILSPGTLLISQLGVAVNPVPPPATHSENVVWYALVTVEVPPAATPMIPPWLYSGTPDAKVTQLNASVIVVVALA